MKLDFSIESNTVIRKFIHFMILGVCFQSSITIPLKKQKIRFCFGLKIAALIVSNILLDNIVGNV